jgi:hypothetical protein
MAGATLLAALARKPWRSHSAAPSYRGTVNPALEQYCQCERDRTADQSAQQHDDRIGQDRTQTQEQPADKREQYREMHQVQTERNLAAPTASGRASTRCNAGNSATPAKTRTSPSRACGFNGCATGTSHRPGITESTSRTSAKTWPEHRDTPPSKQTVPVTPADADHAPKPERRGGRRRT